MKNITRSSVPNFAANFASTITRLLAAAVLLFASFTASATEQVPFTWGAFTTAQAAGKTVLVAVHASWCPTCKAQIPILEKLSKEDKFANIVRYRVDFDDQKPLVKKFGAKMQSTLIVFKGKTEVARSVGETDEGRIRQLLASAL